MNYFKLVNIFTCINDLTTTIFVAPNVPNNLIWMAAFSYYF